jgi:hypothetical protein
MPVIVSVSVKSLDELFLIFDINDIDNESTEHVHFHMRAPAIVQYLLLLNLFIVIYRVTTEAMIRLNPWRDQAISHPKQIDIDATPLGTVIAWMDDQKALRVRVDEYTVLRAACNGNNWDKVRCCPFAAVFALNL